MQDYSKEQLQELYNNLPTELQEALFSEKVAQTIDDICQSQGLSEEKSQKVVKYTGYVLLGLLLPQELKSAFEKELKIAPELAEKLFKMMKNSIFFPIKESLEPLYNIKIEKEPEEERKPEPGPAKTSPAKKDIYREPIK